MEQKLEKSSEKLYSLLEKVNGVKGELLERFIGVERQLLKVQDELKKETTNLKTEFKDEMSNFKTELKKEMTSNKTELKNEMTNVKTELTSAVCARGIADTIQGRDTASIINRRRRDLIPTANGPGHVGAIYAIDPGANSILSIHASRAFDLPHTDDAVVRHSRYRSPNAAKRRARVKPNHDEKMVYSLKEYRHRIHVGVDLAEISQPKTLNLESHQPVDESRVASCRIASTTSHTHPR